MVAEQEKRQLLSLTQKFEPNNLRPRKPKYSGAADQLLAEASQFGLLTDTQGTESIRETLQYSNINPNEVKLQLGIKDLLKPQSEMSREKRLKRKQLPANIVEKLEKNYQLKTDLMQVKQTVDQQREERAKLEQTLRELNETQQKQLEYQHMLEDRVKRTK